MTVLPAETVTPPASDAVPWRALWVLGSASFASSAALRFCDPLLPKIANAFQTTPGAASIIVTTYAVGYGGLQLLTGPLGDRYGKAKLIALGSFLCGLFTLSCAFATSVDQIAVLRFLAGVAGAAIIPNCLAFIGDTVPVHQRHAVLARYMMFMSFGTLSGQAVGGFVADLFGWHAVFIMVGAFLVVAGVTLFIQMGISPVLSRVPPPPQGGMMGSFRQIWGLRTKPLARLVLLTVLLEAMLYFGPYTFMGAHIRQTYGLSYTVIGAMTALTTVGAVTYSILAPKLLQRYSERTLVAYASGLFFTSFMIVAMSPPVEFVALAIVIGGGGFVLLHNSLQNNATQMNPEGRGAAIAVYAFCFFVGQTIGVAISGFLFDRVGAVPLFMGSAILLPILVFWFRSGLEREQKGT